MYRQTDYSKARVESVYLTEDENSTAFCAKRGKIEG